MDCNCSFVPSVPARFDYAILWNATTQIVKNCPCDRKLFTSNEAFLTQEACLELSNTTDGWGLSSWTPYPAADVWTRLTSWKFPLVQLVFQFPRPPLSLRIETFTLFHLTGDPIDTISSLLYTLAFCQSRATFWRSVCEERGLVGDKEIEKQERIWKRLALIIISYDEWGMGDQASKSLLEAFDILSNPLGRHVSGDPTNSDVHRPEGAEQSEHHSNLANHGSAPKSLIPLANLIADGQAHSHYNPSNTAVQASDSIDAGRPVISNAENQGTPDNDDQPDADASDLRCADYDAQLASLKTLCMETAQALAADRATKFLPMVIAQCLFGGSIAIAFIKTATSAPGPSNYINVEAHSIAFTAVYLWIIPTVLFGSVIGVSQTRNAIPHILQRFRSDISRLMAELDTSVNLGGLDVLDEDVQNASTRARNGGIYSWQPEQWYKNSEVQSHQLATGKVSLPTPSIGRKVTLTTASILIVLSCTVTACLISGLVPPEGWVCRQKGQLPIFAIWLLSYMLGFLPKVWPQLRDFQQHFRLVFIKDIISTIVTVLDVAITQIGAFNRCSCLTNYGKTGLQLPQQPEVLKILQWNITKVYLPIAAVCIAFQLAAFFGTSLCFKDAFTVYLQRDDDSSNLDGVRRFFSWLPTSKSRHETSDDVRLGRNPTFKPDERGLLAPGSSPSPPPGQSAQRIDGDGNPPSFPDEAFAPHGGGNLVRRTTFHQRSSRSDPMPAPEQDSQDRIKMLLFPIVDAKDVQR